MPWNTTLFDATGKIKDASVGGEDYSWIGESPEGSVASQALFVGEDGQGSDSNLGTEASPFATIQKAFITAVAGDTLYLRGGTHTPPNGWSTKFGYASGTASDRIVLTSYPGERATIDKVDTPNLTITHDRLDFWTYENFTIINGSVFVVYAVDVAVTDLIIRGIRATMGTGGDNVGMFKFNGGNTSGDIYNCWITGPGRGAFSTNTGCIWVNRTVDVTIRNNILHASYHALYQKHAPDPTSNSNFIVKDNLFYDHTFGDTNAIGAVYQNNIYGIGSAGIKTPEANGRPGGDDNLFDHNTHVSGFGLVLTDQTQGDDADPGSRRNTIKNCLLGLRDNSTGTFANVLSYNNHFTGGAGGDTGSTTGTPVYVGGDSGLPSSYALMPGSPGKNAADNGSDMGADVTTVGPKQP